MDRCQSLLPALRRGPVAAVVVAVAAAAGFRHHRRRRHRQQTKRGRRTPAGCEGLIRYSFCEVLKRDREYRCHRITALRRPPIVDARTSRRPAPAAGVSVEDVVELPDWALGQIVDLLEITEDLFEALADSFGWLGWLFGIIAGIIDGIRRIVEGIRELVTGILDAILDIPRVDFCAFVEDLVYGLSGLGGIITGVLGVATVGSGGIRDSVKHGKVRDAIEAGEPQFTIDDATNAWKWIVAKAADCLPRG